MKENKELKQQVVKLTEDHKTHDQQVKKFMEDYKTHDQLKQQVEKLTRDLSAYEIGTPLCPVEFTMTDFEQHKRDDDRWYSPPFYTQPKGYKMCQVTKCGAFEFESFTPSSGVKGDLLSVGSRESLHSTSSQ